MYDKIHYKLKKKIKDSGHITEKKKEKKIFFSVRR